ncbi:MAG: hypothetical protein IKX27_01540 [Oscillospiraceae bacterium]|nr:hypothetical protein [Oscillospiraceae bacterium]
MKKRISIIVFVAALLLSISVVSAASTTFFTANRDGYRWVGTGTVSGSKATAKLTGTVNGSNYIPSYDCDAESWVIGYDANWNYLGGAHSVGTTYANAVFISTQDVYHMGAEFEFNGLTRGVYTLSR